MGAFAGQDPGNDSLYNELKKKSINDMTPREYDYFMKMRQPKVNLGEEREKAVQSERERVDKIGFHEHDGFFLSLSYGGMYSVGTFASNQGHAVANNQDGETGFNFLIGGVLFKKVVLAYSYTYDIPFGGNSIDAGTSKTGFPTGLLAPIGVALGYYLMPYNVYLGVSGSIFTILPASGSTTGGGSYGMTVAKEWWVSKNWGLGVAANYLYGEDIYGRNFGTQSDDGIYSQHSFGLAFRATFN